LSGRRMRGPQITAIMIGALVGVSMPAGLSAQEEKATPPTERNAKPTNDGKTALAPSEAPAANLMPQNAAAALVRAAAAYEYGDMNQVVEASRPVAEGLLPATPQEQAQAFRWLGIGLFLTNRPLGAETAFTELLRKDPKSRLDPTTTRPELVAFFENLRRQHLVRQRSERKLFWNFLPPVGQFQNEDNGKGWLILGVGIASAATTATSYALHRSWRQPYRGSKHPDIAPTLVIVNAISGGILIATYLYGVIDGLVGYNRPIDEGKSPVSYQFMPGGAGLGFTF
jgi:hypothetical protein